MASSVGDTSEKIEKILTCCVCFEIFTNPRSLPCSHTYCQECLAALGRVIKNGQRGINCPICRGFSKEGVFVQNYLVQEFLELYRNSKRETMKTCQSCANEAVWRCLDCKVSLCESCQNVHRKTPLSRSHKYRACDVEVDLIMDANFYCKLHDGQKLELYCTVCQLCICLMCRATSHDGHKCVTLDEGIQQLVPVCETTLQSVGRDVGDLQNEAVFLVSQAKLVDEQHDKSVREYDEEKARLVVAIEEQHTFALEALAQNTKENHNRIQAAQDINKAHIQVKQNLLDICNTTLSNAKGCSLLKGLTDELLVTASEAARKPVIHASVKISQPLFKPNASLKAVPVFIEPSAYHTETRSFTSVPGRVRSVGLKFDVVLSNVGDKEETVDLMGSPCRLALVDGNIWIPSNKSGSAKYQVFDTSTKTLTQKSSDQLLSICSFCQAPFNGIVAACFTGLYQLTMEGEVQYKIADGDFTDVCTDGEHLVGIERNGRQIQVFNGTGDKWTKQTEFNVKNPDKNLKNIHLVNGVVYVSFNWTHTIYKYSLHGEKMEEYGDVQGTGLGQFYGPFVCGTDCEQSLMVCDSGNNRIQVRSSQQGDWQQYNLEGVTKLVDVLVVKDKLLLLHGLNNKKKFSVYQLNMYK